MTILHLTLKKKWFDMIASGEKTEEYREVKEYWITRLVHGIKTYHSENCLNNTGYEVDYKQFDIVRFTNGYSPNSPTMDFECKGIDMGIGKSEWGGKGQTFIIKLGKKL